MSASVMVILVGLYLLLFAHTDANTVKSSEPDFTPTPFENFRFVTAFDSLDNMRAQLSHLLGLSMQPQDSNTTPNLNATKPPLPNPKTFEECTSQWTAYFNKKKAPSAELQCCAALKNCECLKKVCQEKSIKGCGSNVRCQGSSCNQGNWTLSTCMALPDASAHSHSPWNWLWIIIIIGAIMIILICVTICCVYCKKFSGKHDTKKDKRKGTISFGPMNVDSQVKWHGKSKRSRSRSRSKQALTRDASSRRTVKPSQSRGASVSRGKVAKSLSRKGSNRRSFKGRSTSKKSRSRSASIKPKMGTLKAHAGKQTPSMAKVTPSRRLTDRKLVELLQKKK